MSLNSSTSSPTYRKIPDELKNILLEFSIAYLVEQPLNLVDYAVEFFSKLQKCTPKTPIFLVKRSVDDVVAELDDDGSQDSDKPIRLKLRRETIFATGYDSQIENIEESVDNEIYPKTDEQRAHLAETIRSVFIFRSLDDNQMNQVLDAMFERYVKAGECIVKQGADGDNCYVIETGIYNVYQNDLFIRKLDNYGVFGELSLLYNKKRSASVIAETDGKLWAVDRSTFRRILLTTAYKKRKVFEDLLNNVPMLKALRQQERMSLADALQSRAYKDGDCVFKQGDEGDGMYFIVDGMVSVRLAEDNTEIEITRLKKGNYFGELALVTHRPRAASIYAVGGPLDVAFIEAEAFERILGFLADVLKRNILLYEQNFTEMSRRQDA